MSAAGVGGGASVGPADDAAEGEAAHGAGVSVGSGASLGAGWSEGWLAAVGAAPVDGSGPGIGDVGGGLGFGLGSTAETGTGESNTDTSSAIWQITRPRAPRTCPCAVMGVPRYGRPPSGNVRRARTLGASLHERYIGEAIARTGTIV